MFLLWNPVLVAESFYPSVPALLSGSPKHHIPGPLPLGDQAVVVPTGRPQRRQLAVGPAWGWRVSSRPWICPWICPWPPGHLPAESASLPLEASRAPCSFPGTAGRVGNGWTSRSPGFQFLHPEGPEPLPAYTQLRGPPISFLLGGVGQREEREPGRKPGGGGGSQGWVGYRGKGLAGEGSRGLLEPSVPSLCLDTFMSIWRGTCLQIAALSAGTGPGPLRENPPAGDSTG